MKVNGSTYIKDANDAFSAIWPENVGLFVVTVGQGDANISTGIESNKERNVKANEKAIKNLQNGVFDADIDSVYFVEGERAANGVVLITTKKGKDGMVQVDFSTKLTTSWASRLPEMQNDFARGYMEDKYDETGFTQYITGLMLNHLPLDLNITVSITSANGPEVLIVKKLQSQYY